MAPKIIPIPNKRFKERTGDKQGWLTVLGFIGQDKWGQALWLCQCRCGNEAVKTGIDTIRHVTCGCRGHMGEKLTHYPEYSVYRGMIDRCDNPDNISYRNYGKIGVDVCRRWRESFFAFLEDMGPRPSPNHTLERIDGALDYTPDNTKWATWIEQANNTRKNRYITFNGETHTMAEWARITGLSYYVLRARITRGWSIERALTEPAGTNYRHARSITFNGETHTIREWAHILNIKESTLSTRINGYGWPIERALTEPVQKRS